MTARSTDRVRVVCDHFQTEPMSREAGERRLARIEEAGDCKLKHRLEPVDEDARARASRA